VLTFRILLSLTEVLQISFPSIHKTGDFEEFRVGIIFPYICCEKVCIHLGEVKKLK